MIKVAILDDYARIGASIVDWAGVRDKAELTFFDTHLWPDEAADILQPYDVLVTLRDRAQLDTALLRRLPNLKMVSFIARPPPDVDIAQATELGIAFCGGVDVHTASRYDKAVEGAPELTWGLILDLAKNISREDRNMRNGGWVSSNGIVLKGRTLGLLGLGNTGSRVARYGHAFGMRVVAWSQNLSADAAAAKGVERVEKDELLRISDIVSIHLNLSDRTRGLIGARELQLMRPEAYLVNTSRGPIVDEAALIAALRNRTIAGAGLDVYDVEPLPPSHPLRSLDNTVLAPHLGFALIETMQAVFTESVENVSAFVNGKPIRILNPEALAHPRHARNASWRSDVNHSADHLRTKS